MQLLYLIARLSDRLFNQGRGLRQAGGQAKIALYNYKRHMISHSSMNTL